MGDERVEGVEAGRQRRRRRPAVAEVDEGVRAGVVAAEVVAEGAIGTAGARRRFAAGETGDLEDEQRDGGIDGNVARAEAAGIEDLEAVAADIEAELTDGGIDGRDGGQDAYVDIELSPAEDEKAGESVREERISGEEDGYRGAGNGFIEDGCGSIQVALSMAGGSIAEEKVDRFRAQAEEVAPACGRDADGKEARGTIDGLARFGRELPFAHANTGEEEDGAGHLAAYELQIVDYFPAPLW